jgi:hypothetical protein
MNQRRNALDLQLGVRPDIIRIDNVLTTMFVEGGGGEK